MTNEQEKTASAGNASDGRAAREKLSFGVESGTEGEDRPTNEYVLVRLAFAFKECEPQVQLHGCCLDTHSFSCFIECCLLLLPWLYNRADWLCDFRKELRHACRQ